MSREAICVLAKCWDFCLFHHVVDPRFSSSFRTNGTKWSYVVSWLSFDFWSSNAIASLAHCYEHISGLSWYVFCRPSEGRYRAVQPSRYVWKSFKLWCAEAVTLSVVPLSWRFWFLQDTSWFFFSPRSVVPLFSFIKKMAGQALTRKIHIPSPWDAAEALNLSKGLIQECKQISKSHSIYHNRRSPPIRSRTSRTSRAWRILKPGALHVLNSRMIVRFGFHLIPSCHCVAQWSSCQRWGDCDDDPSGWDTLGKERKGLHSRLHDVSNKFCLQFCWTY